MTLTTLCRFLLGNREAILTIAGCRPALWLGLLFVLSAGFAREYDGEDLRAEPWHLLIPVGASLGTSLFLFLMGIIKTNRQNVKNAGFISSYRSFLTLYWMTAPLAWLYAIPYERFLSAPDSVVANLWTLGLVAAWRVLLMIRVFQVLLGYHIAGAISIVMLFADIVAQVALTFTSLPMVSIMGGVRLSQSDAILHHTTMGIRVWGMLTLPLWFVVAVATVSVAKPRWNGPATADVRLSRGLWFLAGGALAIWAFILPWTQAEQRLRRDAEQLYRSGQVDALLDMMSTHGQSAYPPHWDPPPRIGWNDDTKHLADMVESVAARPRDWYTPLYVEKLRLIFERGRGGMRFYYVGENLGRLSLLAEQWGMLDKMTKDELESLIDFIKRYDRGDEQQREQILKRLNAMLAARQQEP